MEYLSTRPSQKQLWSSHLLCRIHHHRTSTSRQWTKEVLQIGLPWTEYEQDLHCYGRCKEFCSDKVSCLSCSESPDYGMGFGRKAAKRKNNAIYIVPYWHLLLWIFPPRKHHQWGGFRARECLWIHKRQVCNAAENFAIRFREDNARQAAVICNRASHYGPYCTYSDPLKFSRSRCNKSTNLSANLAVNTYREECSSRDTQEYCVLWFRITFVHIPEA